MRRPVKPFVTEYRGGSRRSAGQGSGPGLDLFKTEPVPGASSSSPSTSSLSSPSPWGPPQEDGYEAALRAADALFSGARPASVTAQPALQAEEASKSGAPSTGRVLRVLDEAPSAEMLEMERLEAEHAPKRRGRKPGSKNKPKVVAALVAEPIQSAAPPAMPVTEAAVVVAAPVPTATVPAATLAARAIATAPARRPDEPRNGERYAWVRTRLKPGQQWKRRLPKVAW